MKCIKCGIELPDNCKFCTECGTRQVEENICPNCNIELPLNAKFCFNCGYSFEKKESSCDSFASIKNREMKAKNSFTGDKLTTIEKINLEDATELFYDKGDTKGAFDLIEPVYKKHIHNEEVLNLYLPIIKEYDSDKALDIINSLNSDILIAYLVKIDIYVESDLSESEITLDKAEILWPGNLLLECRRVLWFYKMYKETDRKMFFDQLVQVVKELPDGNNKLERSWKAFAECIKNAENEELTYFTEQECEERDIYKKLVNLSGTVKVLTELTEEPVLLEAGTDGTAGPSGRYVLFGDWPQTVKADDVNIDESKTYKINGWACYKGSDGGYYVKATAKPYRNRSVFNNGVKMRKKYSYYFKMESIKWRILDNNYGGGKLLLSEQALAAGCYYPSMSNSRTIKGETVFPNNYEYSQIRAYLNGLDGSSYDVEDYRNRGFINRAFSEKAMANIRTATVDNGKESTTDSGNNIETSYMYNCNNTQDKIFLLSEREVTKASYGFDNYDSYIGDDNGTKTSARIRKATDYSKAVGIYYSTDERLENNIWLWLRSPLYSYSNGVRNVNDYGYAYYGNYVHYTYGGIVPALLISF